MLYFWLFPFFLSPALPQFLPSFLLPLVLCLLPYPFLPSFCFLLPYLSYFLALRSEKFGTVAATAAAVWLRWFCGLTFRLIFSPTLCFLLLIPVRANSLCSFEAGEHFVGLDLSPGNFPFGIVRNCSLICPCKPFPYWFLDYCVQIYQARLDIIIMEFDSIKIYFRSRTPVFARFSFLYVSSPCVRPHLIALVSPVFVAYNLLYSCTVN